MKNIQMADETYRSARAEYLEYISKDCIAIPIEIYDNQRRCLHNAAFKALEVLNQEWRAIYKKPLISKDEFAHHGTDLVVTFKGAPRRK